MNDVINDESPIKTLSDYDLIRLREKEGNSFSEIADQWYVTMMIDEIMWLREQVRTLMESRKR